MAASLFGGKATGTGKANRDSLFRGMATRPVGTLPTPAPGVSYWGKWFRPSRPGDPVEDAAAYPLRKVPAQGWRCPW